MLNKQKYLELYIEKIDYVRQKRGKNFPPKNWDEFLLDNENIFEKYLKDESDTKIKTRLYIDLLDKKDVFMFECFQNGNYETLNNVLYQTGLQDIFSTATTPSGTDQCIFFEDLIYLFASNHFELVENFLPQNLPIYKTTYYTQICSKLLMSLYYKTYDETLIFEAEKFLAKKITHWEKHMILYLVSLLKKDIESASLSLDMLCKSWKKSGIEKYDKLFCAKIHGLYHFANFVDEDFFNKILIPKNDCFDIDFEKRQKQNNFPKGEISYSYPENLNYMNQILFADIPQVELIYSKNSKKYLKNEEKFLQDFVENINNNL